MRKKKHLFTLFPAALATLCLAGAGTAFAGDAPNITKNAGPYTLNLKLLPAEPFVSKTDGKKTANKGKMVNAGGAKPMAKDGPGKPNRHLVVFISKNGKPVKHAKVKMSYRMAGGAAAQQVKVPVNRMWVAGVGPKTTHFGNNVHLEPGKYLVHVVVNHKAKADFNLTAE